ncbi:MAG: ASCH domain-containing protein, partial [Phycisphaerae bacterium]|nr:ASCH domain-containing protein [Phycisphaerae bacterium]
MSDHLAILKRSYLELILGGEKTIECRLRRTSKPPFGVLEKGERIYLKESSGPVRGVARAGKVIFRRINGSEDLRRIREEYGKEIMAKDAFWESNCGAEYCTLIFLEGVRGLGEPFRINKNDMRGWVVL